MENCPAKSALLQVIFSRTPYCRVSTGKQGNSGLGLDAQKKAVLDYLNGGRWQLVGELTEIETGKRIDRPKLDEAMALCRIYKARLIIAKLDRRRVREPLHRAD